MLKHVCMDPQDPYGQEEVVVAFERTASDFRLVSAINAAGDDILDELVEAQRSDLILELADADPIALDLAFSASPSGGDEAKAAAPGWQSRSIPSQAATFREEHSFAN